MILTAPPQAGYVTISLLKTHFKRLARVIAAVQIARTPSASRIDKNFLHAETQHLADCWQADSVER